MKVLNRILFTAGIFLSGFINAQTNETWKPLVLNGVSNYNGVEGYYHLSTCNNKEVVSIRFINHNNYSVKAVWKGMVMSNDHRRFFRGSQHDSINIAPNCEIKGDCAVVSPLVIKLSAFGISANNMEAFTAIDFEIKANN